MPLQYRLNVLALLKEKGYNTTRLRREKLLSESTIQKLRGGEPVSWGEIEKICRLTGKQPGKLIEYVEK